MQLYKKGAITDWKAVGGAAVQGGITGGAAAATGGASLAGSVGTKIAVVVGSAVVANIGGGAVNRTIQGKTTTASDVAIDGATGAIGAGLGYAGGKLIKAGVQKLPNSAKEKIGEIVTKAKYLSKGYVSNGKTEVLTGGKTPTGRMAKAIYDHEMEQVLTGNKLTVDAKFTSGNGANPNSLLTPNQSAAMPNITTPGGLQISIATSQQVGSVGNAAIQSGTATTVNPKRQ